MPLPDISLSKSDFDATNWQEVIAQAPRKECHRYWSLLESKAREAEESRNEKARAVFALVGGVSSLLIKAEDRNKPFAVMANLRGQRTLALDDLTQNHWNALNDIADDIADDEIRARICDCLWVGKRLPGKRSHTLALKAVDAYIASSRILEDPNIWIVASDRVERAVRLAHMLRNKDAIKKTLAEIERLIDRYKADAATNFTWKLMDLLLEFDAGSSTNYAVIAERLAREVEARGEWHWADNYWQMAARWHKRASNVEGQNAALLAAAHTFIKDADGLVRRKTPEYFVAWLRLEEAIEALDQLDSTEVEITQLLVRLQDYQQKAARQMSHVSVPLDLKDLAEQAKEDISGKSTGEALFRLAVSGKPPKKVELEDLVKLKSKTSLISSLFPTYLVTSDGRVSAQRQGLDPSVEAEANAEYIHAEMLSCARLFQLIHVLGVVEPMREQINAEYEVEPIHMMAIASKSLFVPPGREMFYARGLFAGLKGDFVGAAHLLVPQVENSLRHLLAQRGIITWNWKRGAQDETLFGSLMSKHRATLEDILNPDIVFDLQGLLVERFGSNLRNRLSHGLMLYEEFQSNAAKYLWWLVLHLCYVLSIAQAQSEPVEESGALPTNGEGDAAEAQASDINARG